MVNIQKHFRITKKHLEFVKKLFHQIILTLANLTIILVWCMKDTGEYSKAIFHYEKALQIREITLPPNHPDVAESYNNIGLVYERMGEYSKAISLKKPLKQRKNSSSKSS